MDKIIELLQNYQNFIIVGHEKPDGDAIGSVASLTNFLNENGKNAKAVCLDEIPDKFKNIIPCSFCKTITLDEINANDVLLVLDSARTSRINLPKDFTLNEVKIPIFNIDHHIDNDVVGTVNFVNSSAAATAEIIANLAELAEKKYNWNLGKNSAEMCYLGIVTDSGSFKFTNTTAQTFSTASYLLSKGVDINKINNAAYFSKKINQLRFEAEMVKDYLRCDLEGRYIHASMPQELFDKYNFNMKDGETVIEYLREIDTAIIVALLYPKGDAVKVSLRSKNSKYPVGPIARKFNGGGHEMAAGITFENHSFSEVDKLLYDAIKEALDNK